MILARLARLICPFHPKPLSTLDILTGFERFLGLNTKQYDLDNFPYPLEMSDAIAIALEDCECKLRAAARESALAA